MEATRLNVKLKSKIGRLTGAQQALCLADFSRRKGYFALSYRARMPKPSNRSSFTSSVLPINSSGGSTSTAYLIASAALLKRV